MTRHTWRVEPQAESNNSGHFVQVISLELLLIESVYELLQRLFLLLPDSEELGVGLRSVEHTNELANELLTELLKVTNRSGLQGVEPLGGRAFQGTWKG